MKIVFMIVLMLFSSICFSSSCTYLGGDISNDNSWSCGHVPTLDDDVIITQLLTLYNESITCRNFFNWDWIFMDGSKAVINCSDFTNNGSVASIYSNYSYGRIIISGLLMGNGNIADIAIIFKHRMLEGDITGDGKVNFEDLDLLANNWLIEG
jgi:hypothetical protein